MKRSKLTERKIAFSLKQAELGTAVEEVYRKVGICEATFYNWKKKCGDLAPSNCAGNFYFRPVLILVSGHLPASPQ
jgi:hypothetical protein